MSEANENPVQDLQTSPPHLEAKDLPSVQSTMEIRDALAAADLKLADLKEIVERTLPALEKEVSTLFNDHWNAVARAFGYRDQAEAAAKGLGFWHFKDSDTYRIVTQAEGQRLRKIEELEAELVKLKAE